MKDVKIKRVYEPVVKDDGYRVLVDRLWPRGVKKDNSVVDEWLKEVAPSTELRKWFGHKKEKWSVFKKKYKAELQSGRAIEMLRKIVKEHSTVTLLYAAKDEQQNQAVILKEILSASS